MNRPRHIERFRTTREGTTVCFYTRMPFWRRVAAALWRWC